MKRGSGVSQQPLETLGIPAQAERALAASHPGHPGGSSRELRVSWEGDGKIQLIIQFSQCSMCTDGIYRARGLASGQDQGLRSPGPFTITSWYRMKPSPLQGCPPAWARPYGHSFH